MTTKGPLVPPDEHPSFGDVAYAMTVKAGLSSVPGVGPYLSELAQLVVASPAQRRLAAYLQDVADKLKELEGRGVSMLALADDEGFQDVVAAAIDAGRRTASAEKQARLLGCIDASAAMDVPADKQRFYVQCVDSLTNGHFVVLARFASREFHPARFGQMNDVATQNEMLVRLGWAETDDDYLSAILLDLSARGLITNRMRAGTALGSKNFQKLEITETGTALMAFARQSF